MNKKQYFRFRRSIHLFEFLRDVRLNVPSSNAALQKKEHQQPLRFGGYQTHKVRSRRVVSINWR